MSLSRVWVWTCDGCGLVETRHDHGLPRGWIFVKDREITHRCETCKAEVPAGLRGDPKLIAAR